MNYSILPSLLALATFVAIFRSILRQSTSERLDLWFAGWMLVLVHFVAQFVDVGRGPWHHVATALSWNALELAGIVFLISVSPKANSRRRQLLLGGILGIPAVLYTDAVIWKLSLPAFYIAIVLLALAGIWLLIWRFYRRITAYVAGLLLACLVVAAAMLMAVTRGKPALGIGILLCGLNFAVAVLYLRRFRRASAGVLTTAGGFLAWGAVFPIGALLDFYGPSVNVESEVWNIPKYFVAVGMILTLFEDQIDRSDYLAYHDELTGLPNLRLLLDRMDQALAHAGRSGHKVAVLLLDLDNFKEVNDTYGHRIGDLLLQSAVLRLSSRMRESDTLSRSGGDEFTVISEIATPQGAEVLVSALKSALSVPFKLEGNIIGASVSIGFALYPDDGADADSLRAAADKAMYIAKRAARNGTHVELIPPAVPLH